MMNWKVIETCQASKFATQIYIDNGYNIELVRQLLQHSSTAVTQKYIGIQQKQVEDALQNHIKLV